MDHPRALCDALAPQEGPLGYAATGGCWLVRDADGRIQSGGAWDGRVRIQAERALRAVIGAGYRPQVAAHWWAQTPSGYEHMLQVVDDPAGITLIRTAATASMDEVSGVMVYPAPRIISAECFGDNHARAAEGFALLRCALGVITRTP